MINPIAFTVSDDVIPLVTGASKFTWRMPRAMTPVYVGASLTVPQTSGPKLTVDVKKAGVSIFSMPVTFDNGNKTTANALVPAALLGTAFAFDDEFTVDVLQIGDGTAKGLKVSIYDDITGVVFPPPFVPPPPPPATWQTIGTTTLANGDTSPLSGYNPRQELLKAGFASITTGTKIRLTLKGAAGSATVINKLNAGPASSPPNAVSLTAMTVGGNATFTIPAGGSVVTDEIAFALDPTKDLIFPFDTASPVSYGTPLGSWGRWNKAGTSEVNLLSVSGYSAYNWQLLITKVEVYA